MANSSSKLKEGRICMNVSNSKVVPYPHFATRGQQLSMTGLPRGPCLVHWIVSPGSLKVLMSLQSSGSGLL